MAATEPLEIVVTALVPLVLFPLRGVAPLDRDAAPYADKPIFLFMRGLRAGNPMQRWNLHRRLALSRFNAWAQTPTAWPAGSCSRQALSAHGSRTPHRCYDAIHRHERCPARRAHLGRRHRHAPPPPSNALVFGSGQVAIPQMARGGLLLDALGILVEGGWFYFFPLDP